MDTSKLQVGQSAKTQIEITSEMTTNRTGNPGDDVFSTPAMLGMMEGACIQLSDPLLGENSATVGYAVDGLRHIARTDINDTVEICYKAWKKNLCRHYSIAHHKNYSILDVAKMFETKIKYLPFPGKIVGHPSVLEGTIDEITKSAIDLSSNQYVYGLDLLSYRFKGNVEELIKSVVNKTKVPIVSAGSIDGEEKIKIVSALGVWAFTVGSAAFEKKFANGSSSIVDQLEDILKLSNKYK